MPLGKQVSRDFGVATSACQFVHMTQCQPVPQAYAHACHCAQVHCTTEAGALQVPPLLPHFRLEVEAVLPDSATIPLLETPGVSAAIMLPMFTRRNKLECSVILYIVRP